MSKYNQKYFMIPISFIRMVYSEGVAPETLLKMVYDFATIEQLNEGNEQARKNHEFLTQELKDFEQRYGRDSRASIRRDWLEDAKDGKISFDIFRMIVAIKSVIGKRNFAHVYKGSISPRLFGCKNKQALIPEMMEDFQYLSKRYPFDKLLNQTIQRGFILKVKASRGFFISTKFKNPESFKEAILKRQQEWANKQVETEKAAKEIKAFTKQVKLKRRGYYEPYKQN